MKKSRYFPFERNRYFYGKLLTVRDFESEQKYFNDKRRLMNRLLFGSGVVAGLQIVAVDEKSVSVESGVAIDSLGREIIVSSPVTLKLSMMEGFSNNDYAKNVYLCIAYDEKDKDPVHAVAINSARSDDTNEYNRVVESYRVFIREEAPDPSQFEWNEFAESTTVIYADDDVRLLQSVPRYVPEKGTFHVELRVEKTVQTPHVTFEYAPAGGAFQPAEEQHQTKIRFEEPSVGKSTDYSLLIPMKVDGKAGEKGEVGCKPGSAILTIGDRRIRIEPDFSQTVELTGDVEQRLWQAYMNRSLDEALESPGSPYVVLAKISLLQMGASYMIQHVTPLPFQELVAGNPLLGVLAKQRKQSAAEVAASAAEAAALALPSAEIKRLLALEAGENSRNGALALPAPREEKPAPDEIRTGTIDISLAGGTMKQGVLPFGKYERSYFTEEIAHGLGAGQALITVGLEYTDGDVISDILNVNEAVVYGQADVFQGSDYAPNLPKVAIASVVYPRKGTFRIGFKLLSPTELTSVRLRWWAVRTVGEASQTATQPGRSASEREAAAGSDQGTDV